MTVQFRIYIVRHGETEWNRSRRIQGQLDIPLNEAGIRQAELVAEALKDIPFTRAFSSDLQRASKTAECILQYHPNVTLEKDVLVRERYMGELEGEIGRSNKPAPSIEKMPDFMGRCETWFTRTIANHMMSVLQARDRLQGPQSLLVVSHGAWIVTFFNMLHANAWITCGPGVHVGHCLNTGVSVVEWPITPAGNLSLGTLVVYSSVEHLLRQDLKALKENVDELVDRGRKPRLD